MAEQRVQQFRIHIKAYDLVNDQKLQKQIVDTSGLNLTVAGQFLPARRSTFTVMKSPHIYKMGDEAYRNARTQHLINYQ